MARLSLDQRKQLQDEILEELANGNWPACPMAAQEPPGQAHLSTVSYVGILGDAPTFSCSCGMTFAMDLRDA